MQQPAVNGSSYPQPGYRPASAAQLPPAVAAKPAATQKQADQTRNMWQFMSNAELTKNSPSLKDGIDEKRQMYFRSSYCEFLKEAGMSMKLYAPQPFGLLHRTTGVLPPSSTRSPRGFALNTTRTPVIRVNTRCTGCFFPGCRLSRGV
jgi:hypothetical protein